MGIRFACHVCQRRLNIKRELAGRRGICPVCAARIRIPLEDCETSTPVDEKPLPAVRRPSPIVSRDQPSDERQTQRRGDGADAATDHASPVDDPFALGEPATVDPRSPADSETMDVLAEQPEASWYVRPPSGGQYGPATTELLRQWISEGRVAATALLWREGWPQWRDASEALPQYSERLPMSGPAIPDAVPEISGPDLPGAAESPTTAAAAGSKLSPRPRWTRAVMTVGLLSVLALSLILVLAFAVLR